MIFNEKGLPKNGNPNVHSQIINAYTIVFWLIIILVFVCGASLIGKVLTSFLNGRKKMPKEKPIQEINKEPEIK